MALKIKYVHEKQRGSNRRSSHTLPIKVKLQKQIARSFFSVLIYWYEATLVCVRLFCSKMLELWVFGARAAAIDNVVVVCYCAWDARVHRREILHAKFSIWHIIYLYNDDCAYINSIRVANYSHFVFSVKHICVEQRRSSTWLHAHILQQFIADVFCLISFST